ncbi:CspA family cold shock protein [Salibacterium salarium]|uniref:cold-shock protein n=1 Tax=Salibacterium salarium TaxID=284579 RepID=UPI0027885CA8|nr:cold shock domain-containing protein [Salibacterium salarium]MDQ0298256.1 CspA family cold shock protein [Salibacterium salarium]
MKRQGIVKWYKEDKGYGRIMLDGEDENHVFVHFSSILPDTSRFSDGFRFLKQGQKVSFELVENPSSTDQRQVAENVIIISD